MAYIDKNDLIKLFGKEFLDGLNEDDIELQDYNCRKSDSYGLELSACMMATEDSCMVSLYSESFKREIFFTNLKHQVKEISCDQDTFRILSYNGTIIKCLTKPHFSFELPVICLSKNPDNSNKQMIFNIQDLCKLFGTCEKSLYGQKYILSLSKKNEHGFTLKINIYPENNKCSVTLEYNKYKSPIFDVTFKGISSIISDQKEEFGSIYIYGISQNKPIKIFFHPTFELYINDWVWE